MESSSTEIKGSICNPREVPPGPTRVSGCHAIDSGGYPNGVCKSAVAAVQVDNMLGWKEQWQVCDDKVKTTVTKIIEKRGSMELIAQVSQAVLQHGPGKSCCCVIE